MVSGADLRQEIVPQTIRATLWMLTVTAHYIHDWVGIEQVASLIPTAASRYGLITERKFSHPIRHRQDGEPLHQRKSGDYRPAAQIPNANAVRSKIPSAAFTSCYCDPDSNVPTGLVVA